VAFFRARRSRPRHASLALIGWLCADAPGLRPWTLYDQNHRQYSIPRAPRADVVDAIASRALSWPNFSEAMRRSGQSRGRHRDLGHREHCESGTQRLDQDPRQSLAMRVALTARVDPAVCVILLMAGSEMAAVISGMSFAAGERATMMALRVRHRALIGRGPGVVGAAHNGADPRCGSPPSSGRGAAGGKRVRRAMLDIIQYATVRPAAIAVLVPRQTPVVSAITRRRDRRCCRSVA